MRIGKNKYKTTKSTRKKGGNKIKQGKKRHNKTHNKRQKPFVKLNCSPENKLDNINNDYTCYTSDDLHKLRNMWNARHPDVKIQSNNSKEIWETLKKHYESICNKESCWIKQIAVGTKMEKELIDSFAPESPEEWKKNPTEWLSSVDINKVMKQYEKSYKCFDFIGPSPIDYDTQQLYGECVWEELCHFNLQSHLQKGKTKIGIIFNTDPHYKGGSHWISLFINIKKGKIFFFDSAGDKAPELVMKFVKTITEQGHLLSNRINFSFDQNYPTDHQQNSYSCGVYSLFFIVHMLEDKVTEHYLKTRRFKDSYIESFRKKYFNEDL
jgi:Ulp1 family protease